MFTAALAIMALAGSADAQTGSRERVDTTVTLERGGTFSVSLYSGRANVTGTSGSEVRIRGMVNGGDLRVRGRANSVRVELDHGMPKGGADLDISVPIGTRVVLEGFSSPFSVRGVKGDVSVETLSGSIVVTDAAGKVSAESVSGDIEIDGVAGDVRAESVSGRVTLRNVVGDIATESVSGSLNIVSASSARVRAETVGGSLSYDGTIEPLGNYSFTTHSGRLTLAVPANAGATVQLETYSGTVDSDFPVTLESGANRQMGESRFDFRIGDGRSRIVLETFNGNIEIKRGSTRANRE
ncbi:MAG: DUF4097 family beta strand repeat-containing protein [Gemmatimonadaceae bacterium]